MTFNKYKDKQFRNIIYPKDGYYYTYVYDKKIGWHYVRGCIACGRPLTKCKENIWFCTNKKCGHYGLNAKEI